MILPLFCVVIGFAALFELASLKKYHFSVNEQYNKTKGYRPHITIFNLFDFIDGELLMIKDTDWKIINHYL